MDNDAVRCEGSNNQSLAFTHDSAKRCSLEGRREVYIAQAKAAIYFNEVSRLNEVSFESKIIRGEWLIK